jgi:hypothetical protein
MLDDLFGTHSHRRVPTFGRLRTVTSPVLIRAAGDWQPPGTKAQRHNHT